MTIFGYAWIREGSMSQYPCLSPTRQERLIPNIKLFWEADLETAGLGL